MKKYRWLGGVTIGTVLVLLAVGAAARQRVPQVTVEQLQWQQVEQTVQCSGKVEEASGEVLAVATSHGGRVQVRVAVPENRLRMVAVGQRVSVSGAAFTADSYTGTVVSLGDKAYTAATGGTMVDAVIALDTFDESLKCGLSAKAGICVNTLEGMLIPYASVMEDECEYVYLLQEGRAVRRNITAAAELPDGVFVTAGLQPGEWLITNPEKVSVDGTAVRVNRDE